MKIKLTESQFNRVILKEENSITKLVIAQGKPSKSYEVGASVVAKAVGLVDISVTPNMSTKDVTNEIELLAQKGKLISGGLDEVSISTHKTGCYPFNYDIVGSKYLEYKGRDGFVRDDAVKFWEILSKYCKPSTQIFLGGCSVANNPEVVYQIAKTVGCEVTAPTGTYNPFIGFTSKSEGFGGSLGKYISCSPNNESTTELKQYQNVIMNNHILKGLGISNRSLRGAPNYLFEELIKPLATIMGNLSMDKLSELKTLSQKKDKDSFFLMQDEIKEIIRGFADKYVEVMGCKSIKKPSHHTFF